MEAYIHRIAHRLREPSPRPSTTNHHTTSTPGVATQTTVASTTQATQHCEATQGTQTSTVPSATRATQHCEATQTSALTKPAPSGRAARHAAVQATQPRVRKPTTNTPHTRHQPCNPHTREKNATRLPTTLQVMLPGLGALRAQLAKLQTHAALTMPLAVQIAEPTQQGRRRVLPAPRVHSAANEASAAAVPSTRKRKPMADDAAHLRALHVRLLSMVRHWKMILDVGYLKAASHLHSARSSCLRVRPPHQQLRHGPWQVTQRTLCSC